VSVNPLETYLIELRETRDSGAATRETSGYGTLAKLLDAVGHTLKPKVRCIIQLKNSGAGLPDGGLFTPDQLRNTDEEAPLHGLNPARGVIEVKPASEELDDITPTEQVKEYLAHYGQVLLTNYRDFLLLKRGPGGAMQPLESFQLADSEAAFWTAAAHPRKTADALGERLAEYLKRVMLHAAPLNSPRDLAFFLASYARDARARVEHAGDLPALTAVRNALEESLGMKFEAEKGEHFFRSTLVQTLFYGVFSAWVLWHKEKPQRADAFDWKAAAWTLHVPMIKALFEQVATPTKLGPLGLVEVLDWTAAALNRVDRPAFFEKFLETHAVQYFYEPFLEAFDPALRKQLGVWFTPPEIVEYQVERVDTVLREELDIPDGLADPRVFVLDLCCGTAAYPVQVIRRIVKTIREEKCEGVLSVVEAKEAAMHRVYGFELMPAPFVVAHLQMGLLLQSLGVPLDDAKGERASIFLTNSLTGWDFTGANPQLKNWPELEAERAGAGKVKQETKILVILGNPPYNAYAGVSPEEEQGLVEPYKQGLISDWGIKKFNLDDLYIRFFRIAERKIAEKTGQGIVSFISNHSWISDPSFVVMRKHLLGSFDKIWIENLHGNRKISEYAPDGRTSETIFALEGSSPGIQQGVATLLLLRTGEKRKPVVLFRDDLNAARAAERRADLLASLKSKKFDRQYEKTAPAPDNRFSFRPGKVATQYLEWPKLVELCAEPPSNGLMEKRGGALMGFDRHALEMRMRQYYDSNVSLEQLKAVGSLLAEDAARFDAKKAREKVLAVEAFQPEHLRRYALRPYDTRWCYYSSERPLWNEPRPRLWAQCWKGNAFFLTRMNCPRTPEGAPVCFTTCLCDDHFLTPDAVAIPFRLRAASPPKPQKKDDGNGEFGSILQEAAPARDAGSGKTTANLSPAARAYLAALGLKNADSDSAELIWLHALAIGYAPSYLAENADGVRQDWPRIPLPVSKVGLLASAELGRQVAALLDTETPMSGVTDGKLRPELKSVAELRCTSSPDFSITAGWGHAGKEGVTMPGKGKMLMRGYRTEEEEAFKVGQASRLSPSLPPQESETGGTPVLRLLGKTTHDIYLNDTAYWRNVPEKVWDYTIGGYQVLKKWLSYREHGLLDRPLTTEEAREVTHTARRLAALVLLQPELDANYQRVKAASHDWKP
jgi:hypothetical protein